MKYYKKVDGPTLFSDLNDAKKPGWTFLMHSFFSPIYEEKFKNVVGNY
jgi:hypothetical protein